MKSCQFLSFHISSVRRAGRVVAYRAQLGQDWIQSPSLRRLRTLVRGLSVARRTGVIRLRRAATK